MLKHEDNPQAPPQSAAQARATPEELAAAITRLEARKDASQRQAEGTVAIGDVVQQLGLDATPEEVFAEVQAERKQPRKRLGWRLSLRRGRMFGGLALGGLFLTIAAVWFQPSASLDGMNSQFFGETNATLGTKILLQDRSGPAPVIRTLSETPEGKTAYCSAETVDYVALSRQYRFEPHPIPQGASNMTWPVVKHDGELYLRGWTSAAFSSAAAKQAERIPVYNIPNAPGEGAHHTSITIRLSPFIFGEGVSYQHWPAGSPEVFYVAHLHLNKHAYEKW